MMSYCMILLSVCILCGCAPSPAEVPNADCDAQLATADAADRDIGLDPNGAQRGAAQATCGGVRCLSAPCIERTCDATGTCRSRSLDEGQVCLSRWSGTCHLGRCSGPQITLWNRTGDQLGVADELLYGLNMQATIYSMQATPSGGFARCGNIQQAGGRISSPCLTTTEWRYQSSSGKAGSVA